MVQANRLLLLKAKSINDICRRACSVDKSNLLFLYKRNGSNLLVALGEKLDSTVLAYYFPVEQAKKYLVYSLDKSGEAVEMVDRIEDVAAIASDTRCSLAVVSADFSKLEAKARTISVPTVGLESLLDMAKLFVKKTVQEEVLPIAYVVKDGNKNVFGAFNLLGELENDVPTFYYTFADDDGKSAFLRYDYKEDAVSLTNDVESHAFFYVKLVRLGDKLPVALKKA